METAADTVRRYFTRREGERRARVEARVAAARAVLPAVAEVLVGRHGATEVWLFGSLAGGTPHERSC